MPVERLVQIHVAALTAIGAVLLGLGQAETLLPLLVVFAACTSVIFTDVLSWFRLNRAVANLAAVVALFVSLGDFFQLDTRGQLLAIARLLTYMQVVLFYQRKSPRLYWQLVLLSLLQVVVAAALNTRFEFGVLLVLYVAVALSTMTFFLVHRELLRLAPHEAAAPHPAKGRLRATARRGRGAATAEFGSRTPEVTSTSRGESVGREVLNWGFVKQILMLGLTTLAFTVVLFFAAPRLESSTRRALTFRARHIVGFSPEISLNELDEVLQSDEPVLRLMFRDPETRQPYRVFGEPYLRGTVLTHYVNDQGEGRWVHPALHQRPPPGASEDWLARSLVWARQWGERLRRAYGPGLRRPPAKIEHVRQEVVLEPLEEQILFGVHPVYALPDTLPEVRFLTSAELLYRRNGHDGGPRSDFRYSLATTAFRGGLQVDATPHLNQLQSAEDRWLLEQEKATLREFDEARFPQLRRIADAIANEQPAYQADRVALAKALRSHFHAPGRYTYSLDFRNVNRDPRWDPIEDFVAHHRTGHCEYFASALVMMLRSQGIPARLVVGFRGGEYNTVGGYYQVLQRHAHAWVEAYLEPEEVTGVLPPESDTSPGGGWLRLDPTPGTGVDRARQLQQTWLDLVDDGLDYARTMWSDYILGLTAKRQRESIYAPVAEKTDPQVWSAFLKRLVEQRHVLWQRFWHASRWPLAAGAVLVVVVWYLRRRERWSAVATVLRRWLPGLARFLGAAGARPARGRSRPVAFYRRWETLLAKRGLARPRGTTPREFATRLLASPPAGLPVAEAGPLCLQIVEAFYRVRFGDAELPAAEAQALDETLARLEQLLKQNGTRGR